MTKKTFPLKHLQVSSTNRKMGQVDSSVPRPTPLVWRPESVGERIPRKEWWTNVERWLFCSILFSQLLYTRNKKNLLYIYDIPYFRATPFLEVKEELFHVWPKQTLVSVLQIFLRICIVIILIIIAVDVDDFTDDPNLLLTNLQSYYSTSRGFIVVF